jgi:hypothetical protein
MYVKTDICKCTLPSFLFPPADSWKPASAEWKLPCIENYIIDLLVPACGCTPWLWLLVVLSPLAAVLALADSEGATRKQEAQLMLVPDLLKKP